MWLNKLRFVSKTINSRYNSTLKVIARDQFSKIEDKSKETYLDLIKVFEGRDKLRRGHVEFIQQALRHMDEFGVQTDLEVYKALLNVLPKGKFIPQNIFQSEFMHYPKQQQIAIDLLEQMETNGVMPDYEFEDILLNIFGHRGHPCRKFWRMMYWMPKFKNLSPWPIPNPVPKDALELARLALNRMTSVDLQTQLTEYDTENVADSIDKTWVLSAQSIKQKQLLANSKGPVYIEGPYLIWLRNACVTYFVLRADVDPKLFETKPIDLDDVSDLKIPMYEEKTSDTELSVHEQDDGIIMGMCATGTSSQDSLLSWIRLLEKDGNPILANIPIVFTLKLPNTELVTIKPTIKQIN